MKEWNSIEEMFASLHEANYKYIILRNYEEIDEDNFYISGHADIDFLTENGYVFAKTIGAYPRFVEDDGIHYIVKISGVEVIIDTRSIGDGYYDVNWERNILANRIMKDDRFYVSDYKNYYYSLVYHSILQKKELSFDYLNRLNVMAASLGVDAKNEQTHLNELEKFMRSENYKYTYPYDIHVPFRKELVDSHMVKKPLNVYLRDLKIKLMQIGSKVKHTIIRR